MARRQDKLFTEPTAEHAAPAGDSGPASYLEYVDELGKVPTLALSDEVVVSPRPALAPDFRQGQRPNARREPRDDGYRLREEQASDLEGLYAEYVSGGNGAAAKKKRTRARAQGDSAPRAPQRKRAAGGRKRRKS
jgi:hypothetical protein